MAHEYETVESHVVFKGHIFTVRLDTVRMPGGNLAEREVITHAGAVGMVPVTPERDVLLVRQYRHAIGGRLLEIPAGKLDRDEPPEVCAERELREETGTVLERLVKLAEFYNSPGYTSERFHLYLALVHTETVDPNPDDDEESEMEVIRLPLAEALAKVDGGEIRDAKTLIGLLMADRSLKKPG